MTTTTATETVSTDQLREGDVVFMYGLRMLIDQPIKSWTGHRGKDDTEPTYGTRARVLNLDDMDQDNETIKFLRAFMWDHTETYVNGEGWTKDRTADPRHYIQGNHLATWARETSV